MNQSASQPPPPGATAASRRNWNGLLVSVLGASAVFLGFAAYGRLAPATYLATAQILLTPAGDRPLALAGSGAPATRLRDAAVDDESLKSAAQILKLGAGASAEQTARQRLAGHLDVVASGAGVFEVSVRQPTAVESQALCNMLARHAAAQVTRLFGGGTTDPNAARESARTKAAADLARFIAQHPELTPNPVVTPVAPGAPDAVDIPALRAERAQIEAKLAQLPAADATTDNPFEHASSDALRLRRRLAEIDQTILTKKKAERKAEQANRVAPEVEVEWKRLLKEVGQPTLPAAVADGPAFTVMLREAGLPTAPIHPNRRMVALVGALVSLATGALLAVMMRLRRRTPKLRPDALQVPFDATLQAPAQAMPTGTVRLPGRPGSDPPQLGESPVDPTGPTRLAGSDPPRPGSDPPRPSSDPPRPGSDPPRVASEPPRKSSDPPRIVGEPQRVVGEAPRVTSEPPRHTSDQPPAGSDAPPPAAVVPRPASSNPPTAEAPLAATIASPLPKIESVPVLAAKPSTPALDPNARVPKGTQIGLGRLDPRTLEQPEPEAGKQPARTSSSQRPQEGSTLRPPPPDQPAAQAVLGSVAPGGHGRSELPEAGETEESWTGPSRAHRRSVSARRTTQVMGSPIPPVVRRGTSGSGSWPPANQQASARPAGSTYSYVTDRPEGARPPATPPYYSEPKQIREAAGGHGPNRTPRPPMISEPALGERARILAQSVRSGWAPDPSIDPHARRSLADQIFPLAVERCFVIGVIAVPEARGHKTRVAAELAFALAEAGHPRVLLMEADFQWPAVHQLLRLEMPMSQGLSQQLRARAQHSREPWTVMECTPTLHVLAEGIIRSPGTILTVQFDRGTKNLRTYYDIIVLDGPDTTARSECNALSTVVDGVVYVEPYDGGSELGPTAELFAQARFTATVAV